MSDSVSSATFEKTFFPESRETANPINAEASTPATEGTAINVTEENANPVRDETSVPITEATNNPITEGMSIPMTEMKIEEPRDSQLVQNSENPSFDELSQLLDDLGWEIQPLTVMSNAISGVTAFFLQIWALLISAMNVDIDPTGLSAGIYLVMLAAVMKLEKVKTIELACCLTLIAIIFGVILIVLHSWSIYLCDKLYDYCSTLTPGILDISTVASCRWFDQRLVIDVTMVACGVVIIIFNGSFLYALSFYRTSI